MPKHVKPNESCELIRYNTKLAVWIDNSKSSKDSITYYLSKHDGTVLNTHVGFWPSVPESFKRVSNEKLTQEYKLTKRYTAEIKESFDFEAIKAECEQNKELDYEDQLVGLSFIGTVFSLMPSGKYYAFWTSNQTETDELQDSCYYDALESVFSDYGMFITSGEGDPCDLFAGMTFDNEENDNE